MITQIEIDGYRLLNGFKAEFRPLTVIIGANAVGKSTLLDCLQCIAQCAEFPLNTAIQMHWGLLSLLTVGNQKSDLRWEIMIERPQSGSWSHLPLEGGQPLVYEVVLRDKTLGLVEPQNEVLRTVGPVADRYQEPLKYLEAKPFKRMIFDRRTNRLVDFDAVEITPSVVREEHGGVNTEVQGPLPGMMQETALLLSQIRFFNEFPKPSAVRLLLASMTFYPGFDVTRYSNLRTKAAEIRPDPTLRPNGENLGTVLHEILTRYAFRKAADELREFLRAAYPAFEEIHCDTTFGTPPQVLVRVRERGMPRSMELYELSDGMLRFLCLATALLNPQPPPLVAIDEPEVGLHPRLLPVVGDMIKAAAERTQVIVTTHSPDLLNRFKIDDVAVMTRAEDGPCAIWHRPSDRETLVQMLESVEGDTLGDLHRSGELEAGT